MSNPKLNNFYNFKNPVKNFLNIDVLNIPDNVSTLDLSWTEPFNFRVRKNNNKFRTIKMPNILNFMRAYEHFKDMDNFSNIKGIDLSHKRLSANTTTGDFVSGEFDKELEKDFRKLCIYDNLIKLDIKEYYGRIYTHTLKIPAPHKENFLSSMNIGATNGLLMGNYLSLYFAELHLSYISNDIEAQLNAENIDCKFSYFSDDFYFFCNKTDNDRIIKIFDHILEKYDLVRSDDKEEIWEYESFNNYNMVQRYWKKIMAFCNQNFIKEEATKESMRTKGLSTDEFKHKLYFINQLIYRISKLHDEKQKKVLINNFFKTKYFRDLDLNDYKMMPYDYHQLCFLFRFSPECILYSIDKFKEISNFDASEIKNFLTVKYKKSLENSFNEEQLYFYYAIKVLSFDDILVETTDLVLNSNNQILISYYLKYGLFNDYQINSLKANTDESLWFQNYHLILYSDLKDNLEQNINNYLIPRYAKTHQSQIYNVFYKTNIENSHSIIRDIDAITDEISTYLTDKIHESSI